MLGSNLLEVYDDFGLLGNTLADGATAHQLTVPECERLCKVLVAQRQGGSIWHCTRRKAIPVPP